MTTSRRKFIKIMGGGSLFAAIGVSGMLTGCAPNEALEPWKKAGQYDDPRMRALSYAILAPNPHNRQPWMVDLAQENAITLYVDTDRLLPHTDPFNRQITIGLGCFLEVLRMAAAEDGYLAKIENFPDGHDQNRLDKRPVARITLVKSETVQPDALFQHVMERRSLKEPFDMAKKVSDGTLDVLTNTDADNIGVSNDPATIEKMRKLTHDAMAIELATPRTYKESVDLFRIGKSEIIANPDGIDFSGPMFESLALIGLFTRETALDTESPVYQQGIDAVMANIDTGMGYVWLTSETNTRIDQLNAGRDWVRINLTTTKLGVGLQPLSQALQEYAEMKPYFTGLQKLLETNGDTVQMLGRLGYAADVPPSPRWSLEDKIIKA